MLLLNPVCFFHVLYDGNQLRPWEYYLKLARTGDENLWEIYPLKWEEGKIHLKLSLKVDAELI